MSENRLKRLNHASRAAGNPASTLMESSVGNCFPGLEFDVRTLDRRFFPGLVFDFTGTVEAGPDGTQGARLVQLEAYDEPMLAGSEPWQIALKAAIGGPLSDDGSWYLHAMEQDGKRIEMYEFLYWQNSVTRVAYEGETVWWLIRSLEPNKPLIIELTQREEGADARPKGQPVTLQGYRRTFVNEKGVFDASYRAGELTSSMCSPWTHDFRDCACQYWASNHPDIVLGEVPEGQAIPGGSSADDPKEAINYLDWMRRRSEPSNDVSAATTIDEARKHRYDPYEINTAWQELNFVLEGRENDLPYAPPKIEPDPEHGFPTPEAMVEALVKELAPLEMTLICEYLYAMFTLKAPTVEEAGDDQELIDALRAARQLIIMTAISEMTHLRWANQILWQLDHAGFHYQGEPYRPILDLVADMTTESGKRPRSLRPLTEEVLREFVFVERPGGDVATEYFHVVHELQKKDKDYPPDLYEIAVRIDTDGMQHYQRFRDIEEIFAPWRATSEDAPWLRHVTLAKGGGQGTDEVLEAFRQLIEKLAIAYQSEAKGDLSAAEDAIQSARGLMTFVNEQCELLFRAGIGVDFFAVWDRHGH